MPAIQVSRQILDKHFVSTIVGEPITEFLIRKGNDSDHGVTSSILSLDVRTASGKILHLIYKSMSPLSINDSPPSDSDNPNCLSIKIRQVTEMYSIEIQFYENLAPKIEALVNEQLPLPKVYSTNNDDHAAFLVLEDLRPLGYKSGNKDKGLTFPEVTAVMEAISKFHAQSYVFLKKYGEDLFNDYKSLAFTVKHPFNNRKDIDMSSFFEGVYEGMRDILKTSRGDEGKKLAEKMKKFTGISCETTMRPWNLSKLGEDSKHFRVLLHGDLWVNNILFLYDDVKGNTIKDVKFIDFQQSRRGSIYEDLLYFFMCCTTPEFRAEYLEICLETYFQGFSNTLTKLGVPLPELFSLETLRSTYFENLDAGFCYTVFAIPFQLGTFLPPPSPATPLNANDKPKFDDFEKLPEKSFKVQVEEHLVNFTQILKQAAKSSEVAIKRLEQVVHEMINLNVL